MNTVQVPAEFLQDVLQFVKLSQEILGAEAAEKSAAATEVEGAVDALISADLLKAASRDNAVALFSTNHAKALQGLKKAAQQFGQRNVGTLGAPSDDDHHAVKAASAAAYANPLNQGDAGQGFLNSFGIGAAG